MFFTFAIPLFFTMRRWIQSISVLMPFMARLYCTTIPARCPFAREIKLGDRTLFSIPPLCKLNPFYTQLMDLRFKALTYLVDECGEDVQSYC
jgi:hypothetical protein